jgi:hypothetical protein
VRVSDDANARGLHVRIQLTSKSGFSVLRSALTNW